LLAKKKRHSANKKNQQPRHLVRAKKETKEDFPKRLVMKLMQLPITIVVVVVVVVVLRS
jgi:hypothetical protein